MGCTSSAPSVATPDINVTTEQSVKFVESINEKDMNGQDKITTDDQNGTKDLSNVLPKCDTLAEPIQVVSNNKSLTDLHNLDNMRVNQVMENAADNNANNSMDTSQDNKISSLEKIVERIIETNNTDSNKSDNGYQENEDQGNHNVKEQTVSLELNDVSLNAKNEDMQEEENCEGAASPAHSMTSRVTRWEALADIAAELPPSLAVDPITGQIYALSK